MHRRDQSFAPIAPAFSAAWAPSLAPHKATAPCGGAELTLVKSVLVESGIAISRGAI